MSAQSICVVVDFAFRVNDTIPVVVFIRRIISEVEVLVSIHALKGVKRDCHRIRCLISRDRNDCPGVILFLRLSLLHFLISDNKAHVIVAVRLRRRRSRLLVFIIKVQPDCIAVLCGICSGSLLRCQSSHGESVRHELQVLQDVDLDLLIIRDIFNLLSTDGRAFLIRLCNNKGKIIKEGILFIINDRVTVRLLSGNGSCLLIQSSQIGIDSILLFFLIELPDHKLRIVRNGSRIIDSSGHLDRRILVNILGLRLWVAVVKEDQGILGDRFLQKGLDAFAADSRIIIGKGLDIETVRPFDRNGAGNVAFDRGDRQIKRITNKRNHQFRIGIADQLFAVADHSAHFYGDLRCLCSFGVFRFCGFALRKRFAFRGRLFAVKRFPGIRLSFRLFGRFLNRGFFRFGFRDRFRLFFRSRRFFYDLRGGLLLLFGLSLLDGFGGELHFRLFRKRFRQNGEPVRAENHLQSEKQCQQLLHFLQCTHTFVLLVRFVLWVNLSFPGSGSRQSKETMFRDVRRDPAVSPRRGLRRSVFLSCRFVRTTPKPVCGSPFRARFSPCSAITFSFPQPFAKPRTRAVFENVNVFVFDFKKKRLFTSAYSGLPACGISPPFRRLTREKKCFPLSHKSSYC